MQCATPTGIPATLALFGSAMGDMCLEFADSGTHPGIPWFLLGMVAFAVGHLAYAWAFRSANHGGSSAKLDLALAAYMAAMLYAMLGRGNVPQDLRVPVVAYTGIIGFMTRCVLSRKPYPPAASAVTGIAGALLFMLSDSVLAWNKFVQPLPVAGVVVMLTYYAAQWALCKALCTGYPAKRE